MKISNFIFIVLIMLNIVLAVKCLKTYEDYKELANTNWKCKREIASLQLMANYFEKSMVQQQNSWNKPFNKVLANLDLGTGAILFLRFSYRNCSNCVDTEIQNLKEIVNFFGSDNIILLANFPDKRQMDYFIDKHRLTFRIVQCDQIEIGLEAYNNPYYFIVYEDKIQYPFIPLKDKPELFKLYIQNISSFFS